MPSSTFITQFVHVTLVLLPFFALHLPVIAATPPQNTSPIPSTPAFHPTDTSQCILTPSTCQCSPTPPSGVCTKHQHNNTCLLGLCDHGYRCDCFGFELCNLSSCSKHLPAPNAILSQTVPFSCNTIPNAATCTTVTSILDTTTAAEYADTHASATDQQAALAADDATTQVQLVLTEKHLVRQTLDELYPPIADDIHVPDDDLDTIDHHAHSLDVDLELTASLQLDAIKLSNAASVSKRKAHRARRQARRMQREADRERDALETEREKHNANKSRTGESGKQNGHTKQDTPEHTENTPCALCQKLEKRIEALESGRRTFAKETGTHAREARASKRLGEKRSEEAKEAAGRARASASACVKEARAVLKGMRKGSRESS